MGDWSWRDTKGIPARFIGPGAEIPSYGLLALGASWERLGGGPVDASFYVTNALDKTYVVNPIGIYGAGENSGLGYSLASYGEPCMYGLRLRYHFGNE